MNRDLVAATAAKIDATVRSDLRGRLAAALELALNEGEPPGNVPLPSVRRFSAQLGVHRNTMRAALEMLAERDVVVRMPGGRYGVGDQIGRRSAGGDPRGDVDELLGGAARLAIKKGDGRSAFLRAATSAYLASAEGERKRLPAIVLLEPSEPLPGICAESVSEAIGEPVELLTREGLAKLAGSSPVVLAAAADREDAERLVPGSEVMTLGSALDTDIRVGIASLEPNAKVAVLGADEATAEAIGRRVTRFRPDLSVEAVSGTSDELPAETDLAFVPSGLDDQGVRAKQTPVAAYRTGLAATELELLRLRLDQWADSPSADCASGRLEKAPSRTGIASAQTSR